MSDLSKCCSNPIVYQCTKCYSECDITTGNEPKLEIPGNPGKKKGENIACLVDHMGNPCPGYPEKKKEEIPPDGPCPVCKTGKYVNGLHEPGEPTDDRCYCATWEEHKAFLDGREPTKKKPEACQIDPRSNDACTHIYCSTHNKEAWETQTVIFEQAKEGSKATRESDGRNVRIVVEPPTKQTWEDVLQERTRDFFKRLDGYYMGWARQDFDALIDYARRAERARIGRSLLEKVKKQTEFFTEQNPLKDDELGRYSEGFNDGYMNGHAAAVGIIRQETGITENV